MSQIVVDTDVASYIFNWHSLAREYVGALRGPELILSFMTIAELRMGQSRQVGVAAGGFSSNIHPTFRTVYADNDLCTVWERIRADARAAGRGLSPQDAWIRHGIGTRRPTRNKQSARFRARSETPAAFTLIPL